MKNAKSNDYIRKMQGERIRECMEMCGLTGKEVAQKLNYSPQHISYILNGKRQLTRELALALAKLFSSYMDCESYSYVIELSDMPESLQEEHVRRFGCPPTAPVKITFDIINMDYLLCKSDYMFMKDKFDTPREKRVGILFIDAIRKILHYYGYDIIGYIPDITSDFLTKLCNDDIDNEDKEFYNQLFFSNAEVVKISTGETISIPRLELFQLFRDFSDTIVGMTEQKFKQKHFSDIVNNVCQKGDI